MGAPAQAAPRSIDNRVSLWAREPRRLELPAHAGTETAFPAIFEIRLRHDRFECLPLRFHADVRVVLQHLLGDVPGNVPDGFVPAPLSARSVMSVCRLSCQRPLTPAFFRTLLHDVFRVTIGRVGSFGRGLPKGKTYHSG